MHPREKHVRKHLGSLISGRLTSDRSRLANQFQNNGRIRFFVLDDLLDPELAMEVYSAFPPPDQMTLKHNLGQKKYVAAQMDRYDPLLEEVIYSFQEPQVVEAIGAITGIPGLTPDHNLYAGGISSMMDGHFLNPHLDNSHDKDQKLFRALNLLFYLTPEWREEYGGNLQLWQKGIKKEPTTVWSRFNRLIVMETTKHSWHSVSKVRTKMARCCVSNYFFCERPIDGDIRYHVTTFRGWPSQKTRDLLMMGDNLVRTMVRRAFGEKIFTNPHVYKRRSD